MKNTAGSAEERVTARSPALPHPTQLAHTPPLTRPQLCRLTQPKLRHTQHTTQFYFHEATVILLLEGSIAFGDAIKCTANADKPALLLIAPRTSHDLTKTPAENGGFFRSIMIEIADETLTMFQREPTSEYFMTSEPIQDVVPHDDLCKSFWAVQEAMQVTQLSDRRLIYRLLDLLSALAEHGHGFAPLTTRTTSDRLREVLGEQPDRRWTAHTAGAALAVSEATLRRRLAKEHARFDEILLDVRMHHAMALLQSTDWSVSQIAHASGYLSRARFSERFRERFGQSPIQVR